MSTPPEAIHIPIDLESSLGRIEDAAMEDAETANEGNTNTSDQSPFSTEVQEGQICHVLSPYPISETDAEIQERQRLTASVGKFLRPGFHHSPGKQVDWVPENLEPVEDPGDDEFSLASEEEESLIEAEPFEFERIADPVSFWESEAGTAESGHPHIIPFTPSYSSPDDSCLISDC